MIVEVKNLVTDETTHVVAPSPRVAVALLAAEDRWHAKPAERTFQSFGQLAAYERRRQRKMLEDAERLQKTEVRKGLTKVFCGNWVAEIGR